MSTAKLSKYYLELKDKLNPTLYTIKGIYGDYGTLPLPPFNDDNSNKEYDLNNIPAPTLGYRPTTIDSVPY
jgi:hypothetical protein